MSGDEHRQVADQRERQAAASMPAPRGETDASDLSTDQWRLTEATTTVRTLTEPVRPEYPVQVRCPVCGWVDTFAGWNEASARATTHDLSHSGSCAPGGQA